MSQLKLNYTKKKRRKIAKLKFKLELNFIAVENGQKRSAVRNILVHQGGKKSNVQM